MVKPPRPSRSDYYRVLADHLPKNALIVTALGNASYLWAAMHHAPENFYFEDAMGLALPLALGLAIAQPARPVVVVEGDGAVNPANLTVLLIQNGAHAASGGQALTNPNLDLAALAQSAGIAHAENVATPEAFALKMGEAPPHGARFLVLSTEPDVEVVRPPVAFDPVLTKQRFMSALGVPRYVPTMFGGGRLECD
jgi:thiamine pyrophosphate-dependent acetolactate synthase large subunit-like protein